MAYQVEVKDVAPISTAVIRDRVNIGNVGSKIIERLGQVWEHLRESGVISHGRNVVVYLEPEGESLFITDEGVPVEIGVEVGDDFLETPEIVRSATPGGRTATATHFGIYDDLPTVHGAISQWCSANGHGPTGTNWEVYGHWTDDVSQRRTDVFYRLK